VNRSWVVSVSIGVKTRRRTLDWGLLIVAAAALGVSGCSPGPNPGTITTTGAPASSGSASSGSAGSTAASADFTIRDYTFPEFTVSPGQKITVADGDSEPHTVSADDGSFDTGSFDTTAPGTVSAPTTPGVYPVHCTVHPSMHGNLTVR